MELYEHKPCALSTYKFKNIALNGETHTNKLIYKYIYVLTFIDLR